MGGESRLGEGDRGKIQGINNSKNVNESPGKTCVNQWAWVGGNRVKRRYEGSSFSEGVGKKTKQAKKTHLHSQREEGKGDGYLEGEGGGKGPKSIKPKQKKNYKQTTMTEK